MGEEQKQILQMVADGKVTAEEGARLLEALEKGARKRKDLDSPARMAREKKRMKRELVQLMNERAEGGGFKGLEGFRDIGRMVRDSVRESLHGLDDVDFPTVFEDHTDEDTIILDGPLEIEEGTRIVVKRALVRNSAGNLFISGNDGTALEKVGDDAPEVRVRIEDDTVFLKWSLGDLHISVPQTVEEVKAKLMGGDIVINDLPASLRVKTSGGDIGLYDVSGDFSAKTMGGNLMIKLDDGWSGDSKAATMGGDISLELSGATRALISARTMGGEIQVSEGIEVEQEGGHAGASAVSIDLSDGEEAPDLRLVTTGGDISVNVPDVELSDEKAGKKSSRKK
jgi:DUF4097 and DUF4098 domain-containing protein YvlB